MFQTVVSCIADHHFQAAMLGNFQLQLAHRSLADDSDFITHLYLDSFLDAVHTVCQRFDESAFSIGDTLG